MNTISVDAKTDNLDTVTDFVAAELEKADCPMKTVMQLTVAVDEIFTNIASYAYTDGVGTAEISTEFHPDTGLFDIIFLDSGVPYNPLEKTDPDITLSADEREIGGLGIFMVKKISDKMEYEYKDGKNILTVSKKII